MFDAMEFNQRPVLGWTAFAVAAATLILTLAVHYGGPFAAQQSVGVSLGEVAADIAKSAARSMIGAEQPAPTPVARNIDDYLGMATAVLAGIAVIMGIAALIRHEVWRPALGAIVLAGGAILFQVFAWTILLIAGTLIILALINNFGDILSL